MSGRFGAKLLFALELAVERRVSNAHGRAEFGEGGPLAACSQSRRVAASSACSRVWAARRLRRRAAPAGLWCVMRRAFATLCRFGEPMAQDPFATLHVAGWKHRP
jgi:hypothetical protein